MAEALALVGLASNILQFVHTGGSFLALVKELHRSGSSKELESIEKRNADLDASIGRIKRDDIQAEDQELRGMVDRCVSLSRDLKKITADLKPGSNEGLIGSVLASIKILRKQAVIKSVDQKLGDLRTAIIMYTTVLLRNHQGNLTASLEDFKDSCFQNQANIQSRLDSVISSMQSMRGGQILANDEQFKKTAEHLDSIVSEIRHNSTIVAILKSLRFEQIKERFSDIPIAHQRTFEWSFRDPNVVNFAAWLSSTRTDDGVYWITGKAGSGKSTPMKFIQGHPRTLELLREGSQEHDIVVATHYFWSAGTTLQKSQMGLFRTLLFQVLSQCPDAIAHVVSERWNDVSYAHLENWTSEDLETAFEHLTSSSVGKKRFCFFIDGLDEYDGDHRELAKVFSRLSQSPHFKICVSSRPWQDFLDAFDKSPWSLRVQDLTKDDMRKYIKDNLEQEERFIELQSSQQEAAQQLAQEVQGRAQGVFLWVFLVVRSLRRGLVNHDSIQDMHRRLDALPTELEGYFEMMFNSIEPVYRRKNAQILQLLLAQSGTLPIIAFSLLPDYTSPAASSSDGDSQRWTTDVFKCQLETQRRQLNAICKDLLHVSIDTRESDFTATRVGFSHKTVVDFLRTGPISQTLIERCGRDFHAHNTLCKLYWEMYKFCPESFNSDYLQKEIIRAAMRHARTADSQSQCPIDVLDDMAARVPTTILLWVSLSRDFAEFTIDNGLRFYVQQRLENSDRSPEFLIRALGIITLHSDWDKPRFRKPFIHMRMVQTFLDFGVSPNTPLNVSTRTEQCIVKTPWTVFLDCYERNFSTFKRDLIFVRNAEYAAVAPGHFFEVCELLIRHGASRTVTYVGDAPPVDHWVEDKLRTIFKDKAEHLIRLFPQEIEEEPLSPKEEEEDNGWCTIM